MVDRKKARGRRKMAKRSKKQAVGALIRLGVVLSTWLAMVE